MLWIDSKSTVNQACEKANILRDLVIGENFHMDSIVTRKLKNGGHVKHHSDLDRRVKKVVITGRRHRNRPELTWLQNSVETLYMRMHEPGYRQAVGNLLGGVQ